MAICPIPELEFNKEEIAKYVPDINSDKWQLTYGTKSVQIYNFKSVDVPPILDVLAQFNNPRDYITHIEFFKTPANCELPAHTDRNRKAAINIPIIGDFDSSALNLFNTPDVPVNDVNGAQGFGGKATKVASATFYTAVILDTTYPHGVINQTDKDRVIVSMSIKPEVTYEDMYRMYRTGNLFKNR
jgi:hypothetical protein